jgi:hypothetical protein
VHGFNAIAFDLKGGSERVALDPRLAGSLCGSAFYNALGAGANAFMQSFGAGQSQKRTTPFEK